MSDDMHVCLQIDKIMLNIESWEDFSVFEVAKVVKGHVLGTVVYYALEHYDLIEQLDIPEDKLLNFLGVRSFV